jgi:hypothetical protein
VNLTGAREASKTAAVHPPSLRRPMTTGSQDSGLGQVAYRVTFILAGIYNLAFGVWAGLFPLSFFRWFQLDPPRYPSIWACLGMVVGVYGLLYLQAARRIDQARPIIAIGLLGKLLGPIGLISGVVRGGELPLRMIALLALNDLVWWVPFGAFLLAGTRIGRRARSLAPWSCAALHAGAAAAMLLVLRPGTEAEPLLEHRIQYLAAHSLSWQLGFAIWMAAGMSILAFFAWWAPAARSQRVAMAALLVAFAGLGCDLVGEALYVGWLPWLADGATRGVPGVVVRFAAFQRAGTVLTGVFANGAYTLAGILLTWTSGIRGASRALAWLAWCAGFALSVCAAAGSAAGMIAASAVLFPALILLALALGRTLP